MHPTNLKTQTLPAKKIASFECSDETLNRIWKTGVDALAAGQCTSDARTRSLLIYYVFGDTKEAAEILESKDAARHLLWVLMLKDYSDYTASGSILEKLYPDLQRLMDVSSLPPERPLYHKALLDASELAARAREFDQAWAWNECAKRAREEINNRLWDDVKGIYVDSGGTVSEHTNCLAILFDVADKDQTQKIMDYLDSDLPRIRDIKPFYLLETLAKVGRYQQALDIIRREQHGTSIYWLLKYVAGIQLPDATHRIPYTTAPQLCDLEWVKARVGSVKVDVRR